MGSRKNQRKPAARKENARILILCEGKCTEPQYIHAFRSKFRIPEENMKVLCPPEIPNTPIEMVRDAKARKRAEVDSFDEVWCVFDVEAKLTQHSRFGLQEALNAAERSGILSAMSNPCFEIWLLWHKVDHAAWIASDAAQRRCEELNITRGKHIQEVDSLIRDFYDFAKNRAYSLDQTHDRNGTQKPEDMNPSSGMYKLVDAICGAFAPHK
jgi:hypothetical protein